ncbi:MAG: hypothetical protein H8E38_00025 [SAR324 cluster bacterium]|nr:hypothetical protein [SAR324 cluster bacterium]
MRIPILILTVFALGACSLKPVETTYDQEKDRTSFTTQPFKAEKQNKEIVLVGVKQCPGKVICSDQDIKLTITHADRFSFFKGKDLGMKTTDGKINLNERDYKSTFDLKSVAKDGTSGVLTEKFLIWVSEADFRKAAHAQETTLFIGDYSFELSSEGRVPWQVLLDRERILEVMEEEQRREYGQYQHENKEKKSEDVRKKRMVSEAEESTWKLVQDSNNPEDLRYFLEQFPDSPYAVPAKLKLKQLERE